MSNMQPRPVRRVLKFNLNLHGDTSISLPAGSRVLSVGFQGESLMAWVECPDNEPMRAVRFYSLFTGHSEVPIDTEFVGTTTSGGIVVHVYKERSTVPQRRQADRPFAYRTDPL